MSASPGSAVTGSTDLGLAVRLRAFGRASGFAVLVLGGLVLLGWAFDVALLKSVLPGLATMKANMAAGFVLGGAALRLLSGPRPDLMRLRAARACAAAMVLLGTLTLAEHLLGWDLGIDQLLFRSTTGEVGTAAPGRMAPETALNFLLLGLALLLLDTKTRGGHCPAQALTLLAGFVGLVVLLGYLYGVGAAMRMALHTAAAFLVLSMGVLAARPESGWVADLTHDSAGAIMARRLIAPVVLLPAALGWLRLEGERAGLFGLETGLALFAFANIVILGALLHWSAQAIDRVEVKRRRADALFRTLVEFAPDAVAAVDRSGAIRLVNAQTESLFGYERGTLLGQPIELLIPERFRGGHAEHRRGYTDAPRARAMGSGLDLYGRRRDGSEFPVEVSLSPLETEEGPLVASIIRDVTERRRMEDALRASETRYQDLYENAPDMFGSVDAATARILQCNETLAAATGYSKEEIVGRPVFEIYHPDCIEEARQAFRAFVENGEVCDRELQLVRRDGSRIDVSLNVRAVRDAEGRILHSMSIWHDITARKRHEELRRRSEDIEEQNRRIQEANRLKSEFLANMSHELRTPLNAILGFAQLMHDGKVGVVSDQHKEYLADILTSGRHLLQLVNDVLDLAKVESGKMEFLPEPVDLPKLVAEVRDILRTLSAEKRVFVETQVDPALTGVVADPRRLKQVLYNYLSNAIKFTQEGGRVIVRIGPEGPEALRLEVEDTGVGIRPEDLGRLFIEFQQLDTGAAKRHPGTGLGLALTRRIAEAQGGHVGALSTPGKGSVFFAVLPRRPRGAPEESKGIAAHPRTAAPLVLVIEDDAKDRAWLEATLSAAGYAVELARTGGEALARCRERAFDAIVLDIQLPDMSGWDALRAIRAAGPNRDTPTIVVTVVAEKGAGAGFFIHDYLTKPVRAEDLLESLTRAGIPPGVVRPILVVEDDPADGRLMEALLRQLGYRPLVRSDGVSGLQAAIEDPPAAVVLDLLMPGMDGFEFLERFRRMGVGRRTPVIVWTAHDLTAAVLSRLKDSAQAVLQKSRGAEALLEELRAHVLPPHDAGE